MRTDTRATRTQGILHWAGLLLIIAAWPLAGAMFSQKAVSPPELGATQQISSERIETLLDPSHIGPMQEDPGAASPGEDPLPIGDLILPPPPGGPRSGCGSVVYENSGPWQYYKPTGAGMRIADDCYLVGAGRGICEIYSNIYNGGPAGNKITLELWDACPQGGGSLLATSPLFTLPTSLSTVTWNVTPEVRVGNIIWIAWTSPQANVGPVISGTPEVGYTADLFGTDSCGSVGPSCNCWWSGTPYAGFDVTISADSVPSACCLLDSTCLDLSQSNCLDAGGTWHVGAYCQTFVCPPQCPPDTLFGQSAVAPTDFLGAYTSDQGPGYLVYDNFSGLTSSICDIHFWGLRGSWNNGWSGCSEDPMTFQVKFYGPGVQPGAEVCSYTVTLTGTNTGLVYPDSIAWPLFEYSTALNPCCTLTDGWVSIQALAGTDPLCRFLWANGYGLGDGAYQWYSGSLHAIPVDLAFCLTTASLELVPDADCYSPGDLVTVSIRMSDIPQVIRGGQFFLSYDTSKLTFVSADPGDAPFTMEIYEATGGGTIDYAVGVPDGSGGTATDTVMARLKFQAAAGVCHAANLVTFRSHTPPTRLSGAFGNEVLPRTLDLPSIAIDGTPPTINSLTVTGGDVDGSCEKMVTFSATVTDNCCVAAGAVTVGVTLTTGNATLGTPSITKTQVGVDSVTISGSVLVSGLTSCPATVQVTVNAPDCCGNVATPAVQTANVNDVMKPVIHNCPTSFSVPADAGVCTAVVTWTEPTATDNCTVAGFAANHHPGDTFPAGPTVVTYTAVDECGNTETCSFTVTVSGFNKLIVSVELSPTINTGTDPNEPQTLQRCITFDLWKCPATTPTATVREVLTFTKAATPPGSPMVASNALVLVPCASGPYDCITARDKLHTLRRTLSPLPTVGVQYVADFVTAGKPLIGGNLNDDRWIDILDFGVFSAQWVANYGTGNTTCSTLSPHADISGNGLVFTEDFTFIQVNFLKISEANCCGAPGFRDGEAGNGPITSISVAQLRQMGLKDLAAGDLNHDGVLDQADVAAFLMGARPTPQPDQEEAEAIPLDGPPTNQLRPAPKH